MRQPKRIVILLDPECPDLDEEVAMALGHLSSFLPERAIKEVEVQYGPPLYTTEELLEYFSVGK